MSVKRGNGIKRAGEQQEVLSKQGPHRSKDEQQKVSREAESSARPKASWLDHVNRKASSLDQRRRGPTKGVATRPRRQERRRRPTKEQARRPKAPSLDQRRRHSRDRRHRATKGVVARPKPSSLARPKASVARTRAMVLWTLRAQSELCHKAKGIAAKVQNGKHMAPKRREMEATAKRRESSSRAPKRRANDPVNRAPDPPE